MIALLGLLGCFARYEPLQNAVEATPDERSEALLEGLVQGNERLLTSEWREALRRMCALREARVEQRFRALPDDADLATVDDVARQLDSCIVASPLSLQVHRRVAETALRSFERVAAIGDPAERLEALVAIEPLLPDEPVYTDPARQWRAEAAALVAAAKTGRPAADATLLDVVAGLQGETATNLQQLAEARTTVALAPRSVVADACRAGPSLVQDGALATDGTLTLSGCEVQSASVVVQVPHQVTRTRRVQKPVSETQPVVVQQPRYTTNCYDTAATSRTVTQTCFTSVSGYTSYRSQRTVEVLREVEETYTAIEMRPETRIQTRAEGRWVLRLDTDAGPVEVEGTVAFEQSGTQAPTPDVPALALWTSAVEKARTLGTEAVRNATVAAWAQRDVADPAGREERLLAMAMAHPLTDPERQRLAKALALDARWFGPVALGPRERRPAVGLAREVYRPRATSFLRSVSWPEATIGLSAYGEQSEASYAAHETPRSAGLFTRGQAHLSLTTGRATNGLVLQLAPFYEVSLGLNLRPRYAFPAEDARESMLALSASIGAAAYGGLRTDAFGLFVGIAPRAGFGATGATRRDHAHLPLAARLELRPRPRSPLILEVWGYDLAGRGTEVYGSQLAVPVSRPSDSTQAFLVIGGHRLVERISLPGLTRDGPRVRGGVAPDLLVRVGYEVGI